MASRSRRRIADQDDKNRDEGDDLSERIVSIAGALGFNKVKLRWRLRRMGNRWRAFWRSNEQTITHIRYTHKTCPECGAVQDQHANECASCGTALSHRRWQVLERIGVSAPKIFSVSALLGVLFAIAYFQLVRANGGGGFISIKGEVLYDHGAYVPAMVAGGDWWRLVTACFMHSGLWHIGFNLFALAVVGPRVSDEFGSAATVFLFLVTGAIGNIASGFFDVGAVGASGGVLGLIGAACAAGHREGTHIGRELRNDMLKWTAYVFLFGFLIGANNYAHAGGFVAGGAFGLSVAPRWLMLRSVRPIAAITGIVCVLGSGAATYAVLVPPESRYATRLLVERENYHRERLGPGIDACREDPTASDVCEGYELRRRQCSHGISGFVPDNVVIEVRVDHQAECNVLGPPRER